MNSIYPTTGDFVLIEWNENGDSMITETLKRESSFSRAAASSDKNHELHKQHEQLVAANFDSVFIMQSLNNNFNLHRLERYLTLSWQSGAIPVIILTAHTDSENEVKALELGAADFITKPFVPAVMKRRIETQIELSSYQHSLEKLVQEKVEEVEKLQDALSVGFAELVESRDGITGGHVKNTGLYFDVFIKALKGEAKYRDEITDEYIRNAVRSAPLHDIGKVGIDDVTLSQLGRLGDARDQYIEKHCTLGGQTFHRLRKMFPESEFLKIAENMTLYHHERWDGTGGPFGLKGEEIPLCARVMTIVDTYDVLTSERPYKPPYSHEKSVAIIVEGKGTMYDPDLVDEFVKHSELIRECFKKKEELLKQKADNNFADSFKI